MNVVRSAMPGMPARMFFDQVHDVLLRGLAAHPFEHVFVDVLQRHVHVARDLRAFGDGLDQFVRPMRRMRVEQANPEIALQRIQFAQQRADRGGIGGKRFRGGGKFFRRRNRAAVVRAQIQAVISRVLRNQIHFLHAVGDQRLAPRARCPPACRLRCEPRIRGMMQKLHG